MTMTMCRQLTWTAMCLGLLFASAPSYATPTYCSSQLNGLSVTDVTFRGSAADDCFGVQPGNDSGANGAFIGWNGYQQLLSDESADATGSSASWLGIDWQLSGATRDRTGGFELSWSGANGLALPFVLDLVIVTKAADRFAAYLFENERFAAAPGSATGTWQVSYSNGGKKPPGLSHLSIWVKSVPTAVSEPATWSLLLLGLFGLGVTLRPRTAR